MEHFIGLARVDSCIPNLIIGRRQSRRKGCANMIKNAAKFEESIREATRSGMDKVFRK